MNVLLRTLLFLWLLSGEVLLAQSLSNNRTKQLVAPTKKIQIDSLSIVPGSLQISTAGDSLVPNSAYTIDYARATVELKDSSVFRTLTINYKVFPVLFTKPFKHKDISSLETDESGLKNPFVFDYTKFQNTNFKSDELTKSGNISRGISFGNNQDMVLNSNMNLQLSGKLNENISILAAIADDNTPLQAEGNTQQLQEFDQVFIQVFDAKSKLTAGDFQLSSPQESHFAKYYKRSQGGSFSSTFPTTKKEEKNKSIMTVSAAAGVSKGKFSRNVIVGTEGNQGPYLLKGNASETYIVVLSGTERVYIDGKQLDRGQNNDYVIDYNTAQITFTPKNLITKDKRIVVEFQYAERNYGRSLVQAGTSFRQKNAEWNINLYSEQDNKNKPFLQDLGGDGDSTRKAILQNIGDSIHEAFASTIKSETYDDNMILYAKKDTLINGIYYPEILIYSTSKDDSLFSAGFSNVGAGNGNYNQVSSTANGKVFQWVAPINGSPQGSYEPVTLLVAPKQKQVLTVGGKQKLTKNTNQQVEIGLSNNDINTFSSKGNNDNAGAGIFYAIENRKLLGKSNEESDSIPAWTLISNLHYEFITHSFSPVERYRSAEFERDWNRTWNVSSTENVTNSSNDQHLAGVSIGIEKKEKASFIYGLNTLQENTDYSGIQHQLNTKAAVKGFKHNFDGSYLDAKTSVNNSTFLRQKSKASQNIFGKLVAGISEEQERSDFRSVVNDTLTPLSFQYFEWIASVINPDTSKFKYYANYVNRTDWAIKQNTFGKSTLGESVNGGLEVTKNPNSLFKTGATYRRLAILDSSLTAIKPDNTVVGRAEYSFRLWRGAVSSSTFYEVGSGLEVKKEFSFIEVAAGQGTYAWNDYNDNDVKELNEFEIAQYKDQAKYIKIFVPTNQFIKTYNNQFNQVLNINPAVKWENKKGWRKVIAHFSNQTAYRIDRKTLNKDLAEAFNPFLKEVNDLELVSLNSSLRNTFYFNRYNSKFGTDINILDIRGKTLLTNGFESRQNKSESLRLRWNITRKLLFNAEALQGKKSNASLFFSSRNYNLQIYEMEPKFTLQPSTAFRLSILYRYTNKSDKLSDSVNAKIHKTGLEVKYNVVSKGSLSAKVNYILIDFNGEQNSALGFEMLDGLQNGKNLTWNISYQRNLSDYVQLSLNYDGRKPQVGPLIHIGGVQVRAYF